MRSDYISLRKIRLGSMDSVLADSMGKPNHKCSSRGSVSADRILSRGLFDKLLFAFFHFRPLHVCRGCKVATTSRDHFTIFDLGPGTFGGVEYPGVCYTDDYCFAVIQL